MAQQSRYRPEFHDDWAFSLALRGATNEEIAEAFHISTRTFIRWKKDNPSLNDAVTEGKEIADTKVEKALYTRAIGYESVESERIVSVDKACAARHDGDHVLAEQSASRQLVPAPGARDLCR